MMANQSHVARLRKSVNAWNNWRMENRKIHPDLIGASLEGSNLEGADLRISNLSGARLTEANLTGADLTEAELIGANLEGAILLRANLIKTCLRLANLSNADLRHASLLNTDLSDADLSRTKLVDASLIGTNLARANLDEADLTDAGISQIIFSDNDLSTTKGLETVRHGWASTLGVDTIFQSAGKIPLSFLRGAGVSEIFIEYLPSLVATGAIQFYSCFISYSTKDQEFADRLHADLQNKGVRCWFAPHDVQGGKKLHEQIDEQIRLHEKLLLILSPNSMNSKWVETEIRNARNRELAEGKRVLFPVRLTPWDEIRKWKLFNADEGRDLAAEIREYYIPDFSEWKKHDLYQKEFEKLLRDLRTEESKSA
jgi:hypothetical protein